MITAITVTFVKSNQINPLRLLQPISPQLVVDEDNATPSAEQSAGEQRELEKVSAALAELPVEQRLALTLVAIDGKTYAEAAEILEVPVGTIMSRIARARRNLVEQRGLRNKD